MAPIATDVQESDVDMRKEMKKRKTNKNNRPGRCHDRVCMVWDTHVTQATMGFCRHLRYSIDDMSDVLTKLQYHHTYT